MSIVSAIAAIPDLHMWVTFVLIVAGLLLYAAEKLPVEMASLILLSILMTFFHLFPLKDEAGKVLVDAGSLLQGLSNPALVAVMALLVLGQAVIRTGALNGAAGLLLTMGRNNRFFSITMMLAMVTLMSTVVNDTPTCVMFMPIASVLARRLNLSASKVMIPLSYASILGGTVTLIGSSTNLLVAGVVDKMGLPPLGLFDFALPGAIIAGVGLIYISVILPFLLPTRAPLADEIVGDAKRQFVAQLIVDANSPYLGKSVTTPELFSSLEIAVKMVQRGEHAFLPPFDQELLIQEDDIMIVTASRPALTSLFAGKSGNVLRPVRENIKPHTVGDAALAEILVAPASRMIGQSVEQIGFFHNYHCIVLGIQRRARTITSRMTEIRLAAGDVLLVMGKEQDIQALRNNKDVLLMEWSTEELPSKKFGRRALFTFMTVIGLAAFHIVPIHIAAFVGATLVVLLGCLNWRQARRSLDSQIIFLVAAGFALSIALEETGGAQYIAQHIVSIMQGASPAMVMSALFLCMAIITNMLSNNATALIFTPIAINTALLLGVDPRMFIFAVIFASNCCSFATPIGFQTNLLVMAPGHYRFADYVKAGLPLIVLVWLTYTAFAYFYF